MRHGIRSLTTAISSTNFNIVSEGAEVDISVAVQMIECVLTFLKGPRYSSLLYENTADIHLCLDPTSVGDFESLFAHPLALMDRLGSLITDALIVVDYPEADMLACNAFAALLKTSLLSDPLWNHFKCGVMSSKLLRRLLLDEPNTHIRSQVAIWIKRTYETSIT